MQNLSECSKCTGFPLKACGNNGSCGTGKLCMGMNTPLTKSGQTEVRPPILAVERRDSAGGNS